MTRRHPSARNLTAARSAAVATRPLHAVGRAAVTGSDDPARTLEARIVPWNTAARVSDDGRNFYVESWQPGSLVPADRVVVYDGHTPGGGQGGRLNTDRQPIGMAHSFRSEPDGLYATIELADTGRGRDVYGLARLFRELDVSLEAEVPYGATGTVARTATDPCLMTGVAVVLPPFVGAYDGAHATLVAARSQVDPDNPDDDDDDDDDTPAPTPPPAEPATGGRAALREEIRAEMVRYANVTAQRDRAPAGPFHRFAGFDDLVNAARSGRRDANRELSREFQTAYRAHTERRRHIGLVGRALVDQVTPDNPGLMGPSWLSEVFGIIDQGRTGINAFGGARSPGDAGMDIYWPYYDGDLSTIVGEQTAEKQPIVSVKVSFKRGQATLTTYAGGSDISYQLQRRSSPAYRSLYDRILQMAYALTTEDAFVNTLAATPGSSNGTWAYANTQAGVDALRSILFAGSAKVKRVTGAAATAALVATDVFVALGGMSLLVNPAYGTNNVAGTASASTLSISVNGLEIVETPHLDDGLMILGNEASAAWFEDGPFLVTAEDIEKLGTDVAIWGMGTPGVFLPAGIVKITVTGIPPVAPIATGAADDDDGDGPTRPPAKKAAASS